VLAEERKTREEWEPPLKRASRALDQTRNSENSKKREGMEERRPLFKSLNNKGWKHGQKGGTSFFWGGGPLRVREEGTRNHPLPSSKDIPGVKGENRKSLTEVGCLPKGWGSV